MAQWVREHAETLRAALDPQPAQLPGEVTLRRALQMVNIAAIPHVLDGRAQWALAQRILDQGGHYLMVV
jgi:hypothetical protein